MPVISLFADGQDAPGLLARLNADPDIAFLVPDGPSHPSDVLKSRVDAAREAALVGLLRRGRGLDELREIGITLGGMPDDGYRQRWRAVPRVYDLADGSNALWHVPGAPLPLLTEDGWEEVIADPWQGWIERRPGADPTMPYFGPGHPALIRLDLWVRHRPFSEEERAALWSLDSRWTGQGDLLSVSDFQWIGDHYGRAPEQTWRWWRALEGWVSENAARVGYFPAVGEDTGEDDAVTFWAFPSALAKLKDGMDYDARGFELREGIRTA
jgi:hypothetical protein